MASEGGNQPPRRRVPTLEQLEARMVLSASVLLDDLAAFRAGDRGQPGDPLSKVGYDLASTYAYFQSNGTAPPATSNSNVSLMRFNSTRTQVLIEASSVADNPSSLETKLQGLGFVETGEFGRMLSGWLPINQIDTLSALPELKIASASYKPELATGTVTSQGDQAMRADLARSKFGVTGAGVKVGVLSDSFNSQGGYGSDVTSGDLPNNVQIIQDTFGSDEGRAMAQIVYDVAPQSNLAFATAFLGRASFASNIVALANAGSQVIVDDVGYLTEPYFQNGVIARAVNTVAARDVSYFSSAGNDARQSYQAPFRSGSLFAAAAFPSAAGAPPFFGGTAHDFDPGPAVNPFQSFTLASGASALVGFQWDQPFGSLGGPGSANDVDIYVLNATGQVVAGGVNINTGGDPLEFFQFQNTAASTQTFSLMMVRFSGTTPGLLKYIDFSGGMNNVAFATNSSTTFGHPNTIGAAAVGAAWYQQTPQFGTSPPVLEPFSSFGGTPILFADNGTRFASPVDLRKPDFVAPDGVSTTVPGFIPFFGTSAAAPHAAAVAALMKEANSAATATQIRSALASTAIPMANPFGTGYNYAAGAGFIQANSAVNTIQPLFTSPGTITGYKFSDRDIDGVRDFNDINRNGVQELGEPWLEEGVPNVVIFVDLNNDGKLSVLEPAAATDYLGQYTIRNVPAGDTHIVRELVPPGQVQTKPGPLGDALGGPAFALANAYTNVVVNGRLITRLDFGNYLGGANDYGDAPDTYGTTGFPAARAGLLPGFRLGALIDAEVDGLPHPAALGDDLLVVAPAVGSDEDGIKLIGSGISPGATATIQVTVNTGTNSPGKLQAWVDFNQNGKFDAAEKVVSNLILGTGVHTLSFVVPSTVPLGSTFARFRYGYEPDLGPTGPSVAGEVEDYAVTVLPSSATASPDVFSIKEGSKNNILDVLANDSPTLFGQPRIVGNDFPKTLPSGSTVTLNAAGDRLIYTPGPNLLAGDSEQFTYRVTDGNTISAPASVTLNITIRDIVAVDNTYTFDASTAGNVSQTLLPLSNDVFPLASTRVTSVASLTANTPTTLTIDPADATRVIFTAPQNFQGTAVYTYTIDDDNDATTNPATAKIVIQVVAPNSTDANLNAVGYLAALNARLLDPVTGNPISVVQVGDQFLLRVTSRDLRPGGTTANRGVESAYLDLLLNPLLKSTFMAPVIDAANPFGFAVTFDPQYGEGRSGGVRSPGPGVTLIDEGGAFQNTNNLIENGPNNTRRFNALGPGDKTVFTVLMEARARTPVGQPAQVVADPADDLTHSVELLPDNGTGFVPFDQFITQTIVLRLDQVFLGASGSLTILSNQEGEFVNFANPLDVDADTKVSPGDALTVINTINALGPQSLLANPASAAIQGMVDTNMDSALSAADALTVINYLNGLSYYAYYDNSSEGEAAPFTAGAEGEGVAAADATDWLLGTLTAEEASGLSVTTASQPLLVAPHDGPEGESVDTTPAASDDDAGDDSLFKLDAPAADELFASLSLTAQDSPLRLSRGRR